MYAGKYALENAEQAAVIMAGTGESVSYAELDSRSNQLAHLLRQHGLKRLDHY
ncbi:MAG TPA: acyl-CoA synthetase, partial [Gammaproteobacteria bacterium]|nr:acyl-CoA synthetase [Gammaproteobacteria bacterium]